VGADPPGDRGRPPLWSTRFFAVEARGTSDKAPQAHRGNGDGMSARKTDATWETPAVAACDRQRDAREGQARPRGVTERPVVAMKPPIPVERRGLMFKDNATSSQGPGDWR
jgi:hypothetical protein